MTATLRLCAGAYLAVPDKQLQQQLACSRVLRLIWLQRGKPTGGPMPRCTGLSLILAGIVSACGSSESNSVTTQANTALIRTDMLRSMPERIRNMPEIWRQYHGWFDNELTAIYEQWLAGWSDPQAESLAEPDQGDGDVRMSNPSFNGGQNEFQIAINPADPTFAIGTSND